MSDNAKRLVDAQAEDAGLWFDALTAPEAYLQAALRKLHAAVEADAHPIGLPEETFSVEFSTDGWPTHAIKWVPKDDYDKLRAYAATARQQALEEAARVCKQVGDNGGIAVDCEQQIRALKKES